MGFIAAWPQWLILAFAASSGLLPILGVTKASLGAAALTASILAATGAWVYRDAAASQRGLAGVWAAATLLACPIAAPIYFLKVRGWRGILPALAVIAALALPLTGYAASFILKGRVATEFLRRGERLLEEARRSGRAQDAAAALESFERAVSLNPDPMGTLLSGALEDVYLYGRLRASDGLLSASILASFPPSTDADYARFLGLRARLKDAGKVILWHRAAIGFLTRLVAARMAATHEAMMRGDPAAYVQALQALAACFVVSERLGKDLEDFLKVAPPQRIQAAAKPLEIIRQHRALLDGQSHIVESTRRVLTRLQAEPGWWEALDNYVRGVSAWEVQKDGRAGYGFFSKAIALDPSFGEAYLGVSAIALSARQYESASGYAKRALGLIEGEGTIALAARAEILAELHGINGAALFRLGKAMARGPDRRKRKESGKLLAVARSELEAALRLNPQSRMGLALKQDMVSP